MTVRINGETRTVTVAADVAELLAELELPARTLLVEHNGVALRRDEWKGRAISEGDCFELVRIVAGG